MIKIKMYVNIKNKGEKDNGFETTIEGNLQPCLELLDFTKEFIKKNQKQEVLKESLPNKDYTITEVHKVKDNPKKFGELAFGKSEDTDADKKEQSKATRK